MTGEQAAGVAGACILPGGPSEARRRPRESRGCLVDRTAWRGPCHRLTGKHGVAALAHEATRITIPGRGPTGPRAYAASAGVGPGAPVVTPEDTPHHSPAKASTGSARSPGRPVRPLIPRFVGLLEMT